MTLMSKHPHLPTIPRNLQPLAIALLIAASVMVLEIVVGLLSHSLASWPMPAIWPRTPQPWG